jgi:hypothetical protein
MIHPFIDTIYDILLDIMLRTIPNVENRHIKIHI